ncbi:hypothetical protein RE0327_41180 [Prescottella equi]|nr:hypothetical protein RE0327_41180 [Prescottella equi]
MDFGLSSTAVNTTSPTAANTTGTRCGPPSADTVAIRATGAPTNREGRGPGISGVMWKRYVVEARSWLGLCT